MSDQEAHAAGGEGGGEEEGGSKKKKGHGGKKHKGGHGGEGHGEAVNLERWLVSYADFMTLLFCVFTVLYATSISNKSQGSSDEKVQEVAKAVMSALAASGPFQSRIEDANELDRGNILDGSKGLLEQSGTQILRDMFNKKVHHRDTSKAQEQELQKEILKMQKTVKEIKSTLSSVMGAERAKDISVTVIPDMGVKVVLPEKLTFDTGKASIKEIFFPILSVIAQTLEKLGRPVMISGHTDNIPIHNTQYNSNWELSVARSSAILQYLLKNYNFDPTLFSAAGYGEYRPVAPNTSEENREQNRRVEIIISFDK